MIAFRNVYTLRGPLRIASRFGRRPSHIQLARGRASSSVADVRSSRTFLGIAFGTGAICGAGALYWGSALGIMDRPSSSHELDSGTTSGLDLLDPVHPYKRTLYIMRGVPGCGKSTIAHRILKKHLMANGISGQLDDIAPLSRGFILSTDDFFSHIDEDTGAETTTFDMKNIKRNHALNQSRCGIAMELGITPLIVDNTNTSAWEMRPYVELAHAHGYGIIIKDAMALQDITLDVIKERLSARASATGKDVPIAALERMVKRYETLPSKVDDAVAFISTAEPPWKSSSQPATKRDVTDNPKQP